MDEELMDILVRLAKPVVMGGRGGSEAMCAGCRRKLWLCEATHEPKGCECLGKEARRVLARRGQA